MNTQEAVAAASRELFEAAERKESREFGEVSVKIIRRNGKWSEIVVENGHRIQAKTLLTQSKPNPK